MKKNKKINKNKKGTGIRFPARLLKPVGVLLQQRFKMLEKTKKQVEEQDPFKDVTRILDNASPDTDAYEQFGHARTSAIRQELEKKMVQVRKALTRVKLGKYGICDDCGKMIDTDRLIVYPEATLCAKCQEKREK